MSRWSVSNSSNSNRRELLSGTTVDSGSQSTVSTILPVCTLRSMYR